MSGKYIRARLIIDKGIAVLHFIASSIPGPDSLVSTAKPRPTVQHSGSPPKPNKNGELHIQTAHLPAKTPAISLAPPPKTNEPAGTAGSDRANATFVSLVRDSDLWDMIHSIRQIEDRFNRNYHYDWVFLNDGDFSEEFKKLTSSFVSGKAHYGKIPTEHWSYPEWIDQTKAAEARRIMEEKKIIYGGSSSYRHMCRYESGFFFRHELMLNYDYYWRVEPSVKYFCDVGFDAFKFMRDNKKKYSFVLSLHEYKETVLTLWDSVKKFMEKHPEHIVEGNNMEFVTEDGGKTYNMCHFWSNFEIGDLNWLRSKAYLDYFESLDRDGGFFYERWGDAPVHSIAASLLLKKEEVHFFDEIGYYHVPFTHCPTGLDRKMKLKCSCQSKDNFDWKGHSCTTRFHDLLKLQKPKGFEQEM
ncbi:alpha 1,2-mannosyltransferase 2.4.1 [Ophidiomyces ophidiicola]|uniref:Alpha 1,2-mannosyltransferase 2.4.1 n=1 Tax=Ophidiomyces ophidiicola TaxID=1387563 RepID=A0ACB8UT09_9EURO|nr:alpha 1,2-mannosyltransferase 2.4.1 [Ophidiomyces ophidiicola]KAI1943279.1 alpha 1,2-mannosyltransferase 2.4.1 [Ophidiomyces ophidiicola]KAI1976454.1 alpha 1,2-mannosyltransferase 2.4.1 [Ophidiomyces ophidiicola]KAI1985242.1 alpha 1,2-mannosyltransferase 2.4.1 [Ophidiomyces ophidiicola]KAI1990657.1 alpha 1,2-mannosyltransferase 2.4.1 [Ophidiomyces ophidiicola]